MGMARRSPRERGGCQGIFLDTFSFQARGFYERLGFSVFGEILDYPAPHRRFLLAKTLDEAARVPEGAAALPSAGSEMGRA